MNCEINDPTLSTDPNDPKTQLMICAYIVMLAVGFLLFCMILVGGVLYWLQKLGVLQ